MKTLFSSFHFVVDGERERERGWGEKRDRWQSGEAAASAGTAQPGRTQLPPPPACQLSKCHPSPILPSPHPPQLGTDLGERGREAGQRASVPSILPAPSAANLGPSFASITPPPACPPAYPPNPKWVLDQVPNLAASSGIPVTMHCCVSATAAWHSWGHVCACVCVCACTCTHKRLLCVSLLGMGGGWHCGCQSSVQPEGQGWSGRRRGEFVAWEGRRGCMSCFMLPAYRHWHCSCHPCTRGDGRR